MGINNTNETERCHLNNVCLFWIDLSVLEVQKIFPVKIYVSINNGINQQPNLMQQWLATHD